jgi:hypothetical protein
MTGIDLGTYHVRVVLDDGDGFLAVWNTGRRYTHGTGSWHPLTAASVPPHWKSEDELAEAVEYAYSDDGNAGCDCNMRMSLDRAHQRPEQDDYLCGETLVITSLTLIRPDGTERALEVRR